MNEPKQILFEDQNEQTDPKATLSRLIEGQLVQLSNCYFIDKNKVMITIDGKEYAYSRTKEYKDAVYFQCVNRNRTESLGNKCKAKAHYNSKYNSIVVKDLHNDNCFKESLTVEDDYGSQKDFLLEKLNQEPNLTVINALDLLRDRNIKAEGEKKHPLNFEQVKRIIRDFRGNSNFNSQTILCDPNFMKTLDNAIFRRCYNQYNIIYKNSHIVNEYVIYCSPFQQLLLCNSEHWYVDSTFYVVPSTFYQLMIILIHDNLVNMYIPVCFILASSKNLKIYKDIFRDIKESVMSGSFEMKRMTLDFERAQKEGAQYVFPATTFIGCKFHFAQAITRKARKKGLMIESLEKETQKLIYGLIQNLERGTKDFEVYLKELIMNYEVRYNDPTDLNDKTLIQKYKSFVKYLKDTWLEKYKDGMIDYAKEAREEWTNNSIESYHRRLQQQLTKNPSLHQFMLKLQQEEKYFCEKYFECIKYGGAFHKRGNLKRKNDMKSATPPKLSTSLENPTTKSNFSSSFKKLKFNELCKENKMPSSSATSKRNGKIVIPSQSEQNDKKQYVKIQWIQWKSYSCRIDAFATLAYFVFFYEHKDDIFPRIEGPCLPDEIHPMGTLFKGIDNAITLSMVQKSIDKYINYRWKSKGEKVGKGGSFCTLFSEFKDSPLFTWKFSVISKCTDCPTSSQRHVESGPLLIIPTFLLQAHSGICSNAIRESLKGYVITCPKHKKEVVVEKKFAYIPNYYCCVLDYAEELMRGTLKLEDLPHLMIELEFDIDNLKLELVGIVYFQDMHYTVHVRGAFHPNLLSPRNDGWFYHDGMKDGVDQNKFVQGLLFENDPVLNMKESNSKLRPYVLIYKIHQFIDSNESEIVC